MNSRFTIREAMILHLHRYSGRFPDAYRMPFGATQDGIAAAPGISRAHASAELKKLADKGQIGVIAAHTPGSPRKGRHITSNPSDCRPFPG